MSLRDLREHFNFKFPRYIYTNNETCVDLYYYYFYFINLMGHHNHMAKNLAHYGSGKKIMRKRIA